MWHASSSSSEAFANSYMLLLYLQKDHMTVSRSVLYEASRGLSDDVSELKRSWTAGLCSQSAAAVVHRGSRRSDLVQIVRVEHRHEVGQLVAAADCAEQRRTVLERHGRCER